jgi:deoxyribonuclease V
VRDPRDPFHVRKKIREPAEKGRLSNGGGLLNLSPPCPREAVRIQNRLRSQIVIKSFKRSVRFFAGFDLTYLSKDRALAGGIIFSYPELQIIEKVFCISPCTFPYIPGLLSFREIPPLLKLWKKIKQKPDLIFVDGQGIAHPRGMGIASHLGLILKKPAIGVAKSLLVGKYESPSITKGSWSSLVYQKKTVGAALRTRKGVKPVFISPGYWIDLRDSLRWVMRVTGKYRIPEPTRQTHMYVTKLKKGIGDRG